MIIYIFEVVVVHGESVHGESVHGGRTEEYDGGELM